MNKEINRDLKVNLFGIHFTNSTGWDQFDEALMFYNVEIVNNIFNEEIPEGTDLYINPWGNVYEYCVDDKSYPLTVNWDKVKGISHERS